MTAKTELSAPKRRTRAEVQQLVAEFVSSGMRRSEFCQSRGLSFSTLDRHLKKLRWKRRRKPISSVGRLLPVELAARKSPTPYEPSCGLAVVLPGGRRIEVHPDFDMSTFMYRKIKNPFLLAIVASARPSAGFTSILDQKIAENVNVVKTIKLFHDNGGG